MWLHGCMGLGWQLGILVHMHGCNGHEHHVVHASAITWNKESTNLSPNTHQWCQNTSWSQLTHLINHVYSPHSYNETNTTFLRQGDENYVSMSLTDGLYTRNVDPTLLTNDTNTQHAHNSDHFSIILNLLPYTNRTPTNTANAHATPNTHALIFAGVGISRAPWHAHAHVRLLSYKGYSSVIGAQGFTGRGAHQQNLATLNKNIYICKFRCSKS